MSDGIFWGEDSGHRLVTGRCVSAPSDVLDGVKVKIPSFDEGLDEFGPCGFTPIAVDGEAIFPADGDPCLVGFDENGTAYVIAFSPSSGGPGGGTLVGRVTTLETTGATAASVTTLAGRVTALEAAAAKIVRGQVTVTGTGAAAATAVVTDNLGSATKRGHATWHAGGTFASDVCIGVIFATATNTTTVAAYTRGGGNIPVGQTVLLDYTIWIP